MKDFDSRVETKVSRSLKRAARRIHARNAIRKKWDDPLNDMTDSCRNDLVSRNIDPKYLKGFHANDVIGIFIFSHNGTDLMGFRMNTEERDIPWRIKQHFKTILGYGEKWGYEAYPSENDLIDSANMYWVFFPKGGKIEDIDFNLHKIFPPLS